MYLDKVFIEYANCTKKKRISIFPFLYKKLLQIKKRLQSSTERTLPYSKLKVIFNCLKLSTIFILMVCFLKNSALAMLIVLSVIAAMLFIMAKQNTTVSSEDQNIWKFHIWQTSQNC